MARPKNLATIIYELITELEYNDSEMAHEIGALPQRFARLRRHPHLASVTEVKALRALHRLHCVEPYDTKESEPDPCHDAQSADTPTQPPQTDPPSTSPSNSSNSEPPTKTET